MAIPLSEDMFLRRRNSCIQQFELRGGKVYEPFLRRNSNSLRSNSEFLSASELVLTLHPSPLCCFLQEFHLQAEDIP